MTTAIQPSPITFFLQEIVLRPFTEGAERVNRALMGVDLHHIQHPEISLKDRCCSFLVGLCLMIPLINIVIWICMKTFGNPELLSDPFGSSSIPRVDVEWPDDDEIEIEEEVILPAIEPIRPAPITPSRSINYINVCDDIPRHCSWTFETYKEQHVAEQRESGKDPDIKASFDRNWDQQTFFMEGQRGKVSMDRQENTLSMKGIWNGKKVDKAPKFPGKPYPWIQQPQIGFQEFIRSKQNKLRFYGVDPRSIEIVECSATKEEVHLEPYGKVIKVEFFAPQKLALITIDIKVSTGWYDPKNCDLLKLDYRLGLFAWGEVNIVKD